MHLFQKEETCLKLVDPGTPKKTLTHPTTSPQSGLKITQQHNPLAFRLNDLDAMLQSVLEGLEAQTTLLHTPVVKI